MNQQPFYRALQRIRRLVILADISRHFCLWLIGVQLAVWCHFLGDFLLRWRMATRYTLTASLLVGIGIAFGRVFLRRIFHPPGVEEIALTIEARHRWGGALISGAELAERPGEPEGLVRKLCDQLNSRTAQLSAGLLLRRRDVAVPVLLLLLFSLFTVGAVRLYPDIAHAWAERLRHTAAVYPASVRIIRTFPGSTRVEADQSLLVGATVEGKLPETATLEYTYREQTYRVPILRSGNSYTYRLGPMSDSFTYQFVISNAETPVYRVEVVPPLEILEVRMSVTAPEYTGIGTQDVEPDGARVLRGSAVHLSGRANRPVQEVMRVAQNSVSEITRDRVPLPIPGEEFELRWNAEESVTWWIELTGTKGGHNKNPTRYRLEVADDRQPSVQIVEPGQHMQRTRDARLRLRARAEDDFGIKRWELIYNIWSGKTTPDHTGSLSLPIQAGVRSTSLEGVALQLGTLPLEPGDIFRYWIIAIDNRVPEPQVGQSADYEVRILSRLEAEAVLQERQKRLWQDLRKLTGKQQQLHDVTRTISP